MDYNTVVGKNLKALREANGYTQEQLSAFLGIQRTAYKNYELGEREAPLDVLEKACDLMGVEMAVLYDETGETMQDMLLCAFRADSLNVSDMNEVAAFKKIVLNYMKMKRLQL